MHLARRSAARASAAAERMPAQVDELGAPSLTVRQHEARRASRASGSAASSACACRGRASPPDLGGGSGSRTAGCGIARERRDLQLEQVQAVEHSVRHVRELGHERGRAARLGGAAPARRQPPVSPVRREARRRRRDRGSAGRRPALVTPRLTIQRCLRAGTRAPGPARRSCAVALVAGRSAACARRAPSSGRALPSARPRSRARSREISRVSGRQA